MFNSGYAFDPREPHRGIRGAAMRFDEFYRCYPMVMAPGAERPELNYGSKILLPPSALDKVSRLHVQWPLLMELVNAEQDTHSHCGVLEFVAEEGRAYIPQWMMKTLRLDVGDMIQIKTTSLELARMVKLQPQSPAFLEISDPKAVLERAFRNFATLTKGDIFNFEYNGDIYGVAVLEVKPESEKMGVSMLETDVSVEFAPPVGYVEPERVPRSGTGTGTGTPRNGRTPSGGVLHNQGTMAQAINYESLAPAPGSEEALRSVYFSGEGHRIGTKKSKSGKASASGTATPSSTAPVPVPVVRRTNGPMPLRLPPNKLFFGYHIRPVKTKEEKEEEAAAANGKQPHFAGQGQSLRDAAAAAKKTGDDKGKDKKSGKSSRKT